MATQVILTARQSTFRKPVNLSDFDAEAILVAQSAGKEVLPIVTRTQVDAACQVLDVLKDTERHGD